MFLTSSDTQVRGLGPVAALVIVLGRKTPLTLFHLRKNGIKCFFKK